MFKNLAIRVPNHGSRISTALPAVDARQHRFEWVWLGEHEVLLSQICTLAGGDSNKIREDQSGYLQREKGSWWTYPI